MWNGHHIKSWSKTMPVLALSSGESELAAVTKGASEGLGFQSSLKDFQHNASVVLKSDATAAIGICRREGLGRIRQLATADLWVQQLVRRGRVKLEKWPGTQNPSDMGTKHLCREDIMKYLDIVCVVPLKGRSPLAPTRSGINPVMKPMAYDADEADSDPEPMAK